MPIRKLTIALMLMFGLWVSVTTTVPAQAQENLLQNPGFNNSGNYVDQRPGGSAQSFAIAPGWNGWFTNTPSTQSWMNINPIAFPHTAEFKREGDASQNIGRGDATWTAAVYQTISGVEEGTTFRFTAWAFQDSETGSGTQTRVGIGSNVGGNPLGSPITWSPWMTAIDSWQQMTVEATVPAGSITVFIYSTQSAPRAGNQNYYDQASLSIVGDGAVNVGDGQEDSDGGDSVAPPPPPTSTPIPFAPFVNAQPTQESGEVIHTVQSGDTLAAIAVAYGVPSSEILELNGLTRDQARFLTIGQQLVISEGSPEAANTDEADTDTEETGNETSTETNNNEETSESDGQAAGFASPTPQEVAQEPTDIPTPTPVPTEEEVEQAEEVDDTDNAEEDGDKEEATESSEDSDETDETGEEEEPTPDVSPTPTLIPPTPTDAPPAPVETGADADPLEIETGVCTLMFDDANGNNIQEGDEQLLAGGMINIVPLGESTGQEYVTDGSEPFCFEELEAGVYNMLAVAPDGYGIARANRTVSIQAGQAITIAFAAEAGLEVAVVPTTETIEEDTPEIIEEQPTQDNNLRNLAGIIVLGLAGVVLVGGVVVGVIVGRSN